MNKYIKQHNKWKKIIAVFIVCLFAVNNISWATSHKTMNVNTETLAVQSIFNPILRVIGFENYKRLETEMTTIIGMVLSGEYVSRHEINMSLVRQYSDKNDLRNGVKRLLEVTKDPESIKGSTVVISLATVSTEKIKTEYTITFEGTVLSDMMDPSKISIVQIEKEEDKSKEADVDDGFIISKNGAPTSLRQLLFYLYEQGDSDLLNLVDNERQDSIDLNSFLLILGEKEAAFERINALVETGRLNEMLPELMKLEDAGEEAEGKGITTLQKTLKIIKAIDKYVVQNSLSGDRARGLRLLAIFHAVGEGDNIWDTDSRGKLSDKSADIFEAILLRANFSTSDFEKTLFAIKHQDILKEISEKGEDKQTDIIGKFIKDIFKSGKNIEGSLEILEDIYTLTRTKYPRKNLGKLYQQISQQIERDSGTSVKKRKQPRDQDNSKKQDLAIQLMKSIMGRVGQGGETVISPRITGNIQRFIDDPKVIFFDALVNMDSHTVQEDEDYILGFSSSNPILAQYYVFNGQAIGLINEIIEEGKLKKYVRKIIGKYGLDIEPSVDVLRSLQAEYIFHELICGEGDIDHTIARDLRQKIFPENYLNNGKLSEGLLREVLRSIIEDKSGDFSEENIETHSLSNLLSLFYPDQADDVKKHIWGFRKNYFKKDDFGNKAYGSFVETLASYLMLHRGIDRSNRYEIFKIYLRFFRWTHRLSAFNTKYFPDELFDILMNHPTAPLINNRNIVPLVRRVADIYDEYADHPRIFSLVIGEFKRRCYSLKDESPEDIVIVSILDEVSEEVAKIYKKLGPLFHQVLRLGFFADEKMYELRRYNSDVSRLAEGYEMEWEVFLDDMVLGEIGDNAIEEAFKLFEEKYKSSEHSTFMKIRYLLMVRDYRTLRKLIVKKRIPVKVLVSAQISNNLRAIFAQHHDLIKRLEGQKRESVILRGMVSVKDKMDYSVFVFDDIKSMLDNLCQDADIDNIKSIISHLGFKIVVDDNNNLISPIAFDDLLTVFRGSIKMDDFKAVYNTHALTTALLHYAAQGGEAAEGTWQGNRSDSWHAVHEKDFQLMLMEGFDRKADRTVTWAFSLSEPDPEYMHKRALVLREGTFVHMAQRLMGWHYKERRAKQNLYDLFAHLIDGQINKGELDKVKRHIVKQLNVLYNECGLEDAYLEMVYGHLYEFLDQFESFISKYRRGKRGVNDEALRNALIEAMNKRIQNHPVLMGYEVWHDPYNPQDRQGSLSEITTKDHPWFKKDKTIIDYFRMERIFREGTYDDDDVSTIVVKDGVVSEESTDMIGKIEKVAGKAHKKTDLIQLTMGDITISELHNHFNRVSEHLRLHPAEIRIELSLIPKHFLEESMKTWALLAALHNRYGLDMRYVFVEADKIDSEISYKRKAEELFIKHFMGLTEKGQGEAQLLLRSHANTDKPVLVTWISEESKIRKMLYFPEKMQHIYPIAMSGEVLESGVGMPDFISASNIGLVQLACAKAKIEDEKSHQKESKLPRVVEDVYKSLQEVYGILLPNETISEKDMLSMIDDDPEVRINLALSLILPPVMRMPVEKIKELYNAIHSVLKAA